MTTITTARLAHSRKLLLGVSIFVALVSLGSSALAQDPWDHKIGAHRFVLLIPFASAAVLDRETGIVWARSPIPGTFTWAGAHDFCNTLTIGNRKGWRVPTIQELTSILSVGLGYPNNLEPTHPFQGLPLVTQPIWSATTNAGNTAQAWYMVLQGGVSNNLPKTPTQAVCWCVRFRQSVDLQ